MSSRLRSCTVTDADHCWAISSGKSAVKYCTLTTASLPVTFACTMPGTRNEPFGKGGMRVTVESKNAQGREQKWTYTTMFDGKDEPVTGHPSADTTSVKKIDARTTEITNKKAGKVIQIITNVISEDGNTINNSYQNFDADGKPTRTTTAVYERIP